MSVNRDRFKVSVAVTSGGAADQLAYTFTAEDIGTMATIVFVVANFSGSVTAGLTLKDNDGNTVWSVSSIAKGAATPIVLDIDVFPGDTLRITTSGDIGNGANVCYIKPYIRK